MVYETNCTEITQDKWRELMKYGRKCSYRLLTARIKRELPELYHALALQFYNPTNVFTTDYYSIFYR